MFDFNDSNGMLLKEKIIGVGKFGAKMANYSIENIRFGVSFAVVGTRYETLLKSSAPQRIKVEDSDSEKSKEIFSELIAKLDLLFIFTDLNDENISIQIAETAKKSLNSAILPKFAEKVLTVAILPSSALNKKIFEKFQSAVDTFVVVENENPQLMFNVVRCINELLSDSNIITLDFGDVSTILRNGGRSYIFYGKAEGEDAVLNSVKIAINLIPNFFGNCKKMLVGIFVNLEKFSMSKCNNEFLMATQSAVHPDAEIMWGIVDDKTLFYSAETIIIANSNFNS